MQNDESDRLVAYMAELWGGRWKPTRAELDAWFGVFKRFDYYLAKQAIVRSWEHKNYGKPDPDKIKARCFNAQNEQDGTQDEFDPMTGFWVQQVTRRDGSNGGRVVPLCYGRKLMPDDRGVMARDAEEMRQAHEDQYGGTWRVLEGHTAHDAALARATVQFEPQESS